MTTYLEDETSVEDSQPREGIEIICPAFTDYIATGDQPITIGGNVYTPGPAMRGESILSLVGAPASLQVTLPVQHRAMQRYFLNLCPPRQITINVYRLQLTSNAYVRVWSGQVTAVAIDGHLAKITVPARSARVLQRRLPTITAGRACPVLLYGTKCGVSRASFTVTTTVSSFAANTVTVGSMSGHPDQWAQFGELLHVASGERMTIGSQVGSVITLRYPIAELGDGDSVQVFAGCDHLVLTCRTKFDNVPNFRGLPALPIKNPFAPNAFGFIQVT